MKQAALPPDMQRRAKNAKGAKVFCRLCPSVFAIHFTTKTILDRNLRAE